MSLTSRVMCTGVEILGALLSILVIWAVTGVLVLEAISR